MGQHGGWRTRIMRGSGIRAPEGRDGLQTVARWAVAVPPRRRVRAAVCLGNQRPLIRLKTNFQTACQPPGRNRAVRAGLFVLPQGEAAAALAQCLPVSLAACLLGGVLP